MLEMDDLKEWDKYLKSNVPVILQAGATWCGPSQSLKPTLETSAKEFKGHAQYVLMDIDRFPEIAELLEIRHIPQTFMMHKGDLLD